MIADGDVSSAIRLVRCLNKMEALILPKLIASLAVKRYPAELTLKKNSRVLKIFTLKSLNHISNGVLNMAKPYYEFFCPVKVIAGNAALEHIPLNLQL